MGPRHYSRGNGLISYKDWVDFILFQWGHDITVVETSLSFLNTSTPKDVSMGPRHYSRGNKGEKDEYLIKPFGFQWGHDITVVETHISIKKF